MSRSEWLIGFAGFVIAALIVFFAFRPGKDASVEIEVSPRGSTISIDGKRSSEGKNSIDSGIHTIKIEKKGFTAIEEQFSLDKNENKYLGYALASDSEKTSSYYDKNQEELRRMEGIVGKAEDTKSENFSMRMPLLQDLPVTLLGDQNKLIDIDSGNSIKQNGPPAIYISAENVNSRLQAIKWIRDRGYEVSDYDIVFKFYDTLLFEDMD